MTNRVLTVDYILLGLEPGDRVLDVGCGVGRHVNGACHLPCLAVGVDILHSDLKEAKRRAAESRSEHWIKGQAAFAMADGGTLPFADGTFDRLVGCEVLEHVPDDLGMMREMVRVLRPGGRIVVSVPRFLPEAICWWLNRPLMTFPGSHVRIYPPGWVEQRLEELGLEAYAHEHEHAYWGLYWIARSALDRLFGGRRAERMLKPAERVLNRYVMRPSRFAALVEDLLNRRFSKSCVMYFRKPFDWERGSNTDEE